MSAKHIVFIVGPTAVGKSDVALCLAEYIGGEIVSCDAMQIYKELRIANNKPSEGDLRRIPHWLIDIVSIEEEFDVARYNDLAVRAIEDIHTRGRIPIVTGGSGMYMQILLDGIFLGGQKNDALRKDLKEESRQYGNQALYDKLKMMDPQAAAKIHPNDIRRVVRALEICLTECKPMSQMQKEREGLWANYAIRLFALNRDRQILYEGIGARVEQMVANGLVEEIRGVRDARWSLTAGKIIGVQEILGYLRDEYDLESAKGQMKLNTRHLAKRQLTWFRKEKRLEWMDIAENETAEETAGRILKQYKMGLSEGGQ